MSLYEDSYYDSTPAAPGVRGNPVVAPRLLAAAPTIVSVVGDSVATWSAAVRAKPGSDAGKGSFPSQLRRILGTGYVVHNHAHEGKTLMTDSLCGHGPHAKETCLKQPVPTCDPKPKTCSYRKTAEFKAAMACAPDVVAIMLGTNDAKGCNWNHRPKKETEKRFSEDYVSLIEAFKALPSTPRVYVLIPPPGISRCADTGVAGSADVYLAYGVDFAAINEAIPRLLPEIAKKAGADGVIDVWNAFNGTGVSPKHSYDGVHPTDMASAVIAQLIAKTVRTQ